MLNETKNYGTVITTAGAALIAKCIQKAEVIAFDDLGCESIKRMTISELPLTVALDCHGGNLYRTGRLEYER